MKIIYLYPETGFNTELRSDTLWGIICWGIRNVYGIEDFEKFLGSYFSGNPDLIISSAFPMVQRKDSTTLFLPKPSFRTKPYFDPSGMFTRREIINKSALDKENKKKPYIELGDFIKIIHGETEIEEALANSRPPGLKPFSFTHNTIDRIKGATLQKDNMGQLFHMDEYYFAASPDDELTYGLFFLADGPGIDLLEGAMRWLGHTGLGGDRNIGKGKFKFNISDFQLTQPEGANAFVTLSLYHPSQEAKELDKFKGSSFFNYMLEERRGYYGAPRPGMYIKPPVLMFKEGSVFPAIIGQEKFGTLVRMSGKDGQVMGGHPVYHNGIGFMVKMKIRNE